MNVTAGAVLVLALVPGLGLRTWWTYVRHWNDADYNAPQFAERIMHDLPADGGYVVGIEYVLDFYAAGRHTLIGETDAFYLESKSFPFDYLVVGHDGISQQLPHMMNAQLLRSHGRRDDPFACYAEVYVPADK